MNFSVAALGLSFLICLFIAAVFFSSLVKNNFLRENHFSAAISICGTIILGLCPVIAVFWYPCDFINNFRLWQFFIPPATTLLIIAALFVRRPFTVAAAVFVAALISIFTAGFEIVIIPSIPLFANQLLAAVALSGFALGWRTLSGLNPLPQTQGISVCIGFLILYFLGNAPLVMGICSAGILATLIIAYLYSKVQPVGLQASPLLGFIIGWLGLISYNEYLFSCFVIFTTFYLLELIVSLARKLTFLPQYKEIAYNGITLQAYSEGLPPYMVIRTIWNTDILLIIFGLFQIHAGNNYSIPVFTALITCWQLYRISNWQTASQTLKETNRELVKEVKKSFARFFPSEEEKPQKDVSDKQDKE